MYSFTIFFKEKLTTLQESIPVGCVPPACHRMGGVSLTQTPSALPRDTPGHRPPDRDPPSLDGPPWSPRQRHPPKEHGARDRPPRRNIGPVIQTGSNIIERPPPPCGQTDTCKNIILPKTSFTGGKNKRTGLPQYRENIDRNGEFGCSFFQTGKTQGLCQKYLHKKFSSNISFNKNTFQ